LITLQHHGFELRMPCSDDADDDGDDDDDDDDDVDVEGQSSSLPASTHLSLAC
jgi:hypothetical protein